MKNFADKNIVCILHPEIDKKHKIMKTMKQIMTEAHRMAKTMEGNYQARLSEAMKIAWASAKKSDNTIEVLIKGKVRYGATKKQYEYLNSFENVGLYIAQNRFCNHITKQEASRLIGLAKEGKTIEISL